MNNIAGKTGSLFVLMTDTININETYVKIIYEK